MMKKIFWLVLICMLLVCNAAMADTIDLLKPMWLNALEDMQEAKQEKEEAAVIAEPVVTCAEADLELVRANVYMENEYSTEAYVYAELKNTGENILRLSSAAVTALDTNGKPIKKREYVSAKPDVIMPGGSLYVSEWFYDFVSDLSRVGSFEIAMERSEYSRKQITMIEGSRAYIEGDYLYAQVHNASDKPLFKAGVTAVVTDANGRILDIMQEESYSNLGIAPGSTVIFRKRISQYAADAVNPVCEAYGFAYSE